MDCSPPGFSVHEISQARILEWVVICFSRGCSPRGDLNPSLPHCRQTLYQLSRQGIQHRVLPKMKNVSSRSVFSFSPFHGSFWLKVQTFGKERKWSSSLLDPNRASRPQLAPRRKLFTQAHRVNYKGWEWMEIAKQPAYLSDEEEDNKVLEEEIKPRTSFTSNHSPLPQGRASFTWTCLLLAARKGRTDTRWALMGGSWPVYFSTRSLNLKITVTSWGGSFSHLLPPGPPLLALPSLLKRRIASGENKPQVSLHVNNINGKLREESPGDLGSCHHLREQGRFMLRTRMWTCQWIILLCQGKLDGGEACVQEAEPGLGCSPGVWHLGKRSYLLFL